MYVINEVLGKFKFKLMIGLLITNLRKLLDSTLVMQS